MTNVSLITGAQGPYTNKTGNYGRNAGANLKQYFAAPAAEPSTPSSNSPKSPFGDLFNMDNLSALTQLFQNFMNPGGSDPKEMMKSIFKLLGGKLGGAPKNTPDVQFIAPNNLSSGRKVDDALGYAKEVLDAQVGSTGSNGSPFPSLPKLDGDALEAQKKQMKAMIDMMGGMFGDDMKQQMNDMLENMDGDPSKMLEQLQEQLGVDMGDIFPGGKAVKLSLSDSLLDRDGNGKVDLAEKAAEALFMDDSVNRLKSAIADQLADPMFEVENFEKATQLKTLQGTLQNEASTEDGIITAKERQWAISAGDQDATAEVVGGILDLILVREELRSQATTFEANELL